MTTREVKVHCRDADLDGTLTVPEAARSLVIFAHGSGSSRFSSRNRYVASMLQRAGHSTLLMDLLTRSEEAVDERTAELRFDIGFLAQRVADATAWASVDEQTIGMSVGYFGASTGGGAALVASLIAGNIGAVVSRGGRPDLAADALPKVTSPTLLIVGGDDDVVLGLNRRAYAQLNCEKQLEIVPGATHLFEEPGTLEQVAKLAEDWFTRHLLAVNRRNVAS